MPEIVEVRIMSEYINQNSESKKFNKLFNVEKGNIPNQQIDSIFEVSSESNGKELIVYLKEAIITPIYVFMGMSGNWKYVHTNEWNKTKFVRLRMDDDTGHSLLLYGGYMGPKYKIGEMFGGIKRGPDPIKEFDKFKSNILQNLDKKDFNHPIYETLLNQKYFNGIGNYIRSTILYYLDVNPFQSARDIIQNHPKILDLCRDVPLKSYSLNGGQLRDWKNPFDTDSQSFSDWVFYQKGESIKDSNGRTFWYDTKWKK